MTAFEDPIILQREEFVRVSEITGGSAFCDLAEPRFLALLYQADVEAGYERLTQVGSKYLGYIDEIYHQAQRARRYDHLAGLFLYYRNQIIGLQKWNHDPSFLFLRDVRFPSDSHAPEEDIMIGQLASLTTYFDEYSQLPNIIDKAEMEANFHYKSTDDGIYTFVDLEECAPIMLEFWYKRRFGIDKRRRPELKIGAYPYRKCTDRKDLRHLQTIREKKKATFPNSVDELDGNEFLLEILFERRQYFEKILANLLSQK